MIGMDWAALARGALWILGLSISLAAFSHARWDAKQSGIPLRTAMGWDSFLAPFLGGLVLFAAGMAWGAPRLWETVIWLALAAFFAAQAILSARNARRGPQERNEAHETDK